MGVVAAHGDYSDHSRYRDYTKYGDASLKLEIEEAKEKARKREREFEHLRHEVEQRVENSVRTFQENGLLAVGEDNLDAAEDRLRALAEELEAEIAKDQAELESIDEAIRRISEFQLSRK